MYKSGYLFELQGVCDMISKLLSLHQSYFNISVLFTSFVRPIFLTFRLKTNRYNHLHEVYNHATSNDDENDHNDDGNDNDDEDTDDANENGDDNIVTYPVKFEKGGHHHNRITMLFPNHSPHIIYSQFSGT